MQYNDFTITIAARQGNGYPASAMAEGVGRCATVLESPPAELVELIGRVDALSPVGRHDELLTAAGVALFRWLAGPLETHLRVAWDRAEHEGRGLRIRLSIDAPEINAWPWELLHDPQRDRTFATSIATPLVRYLDRADQFGGLASLRAELPLRMLVVLPRAADLNLVKERAVIEQAVSLLEKEIALNVLDGAVTRARFADALITGDYHIVHGSGHGGVADGISYIGLNYPDGSADWVDGQVMARFIANCKSLRLAVLNVCSSGKVDEGRAFQGLAPQLVRAGLPAVVAMQFPLSDDAAMTFAEEFYRRLCTGEHSIGRVDVAVTYARNMLAILYPGDRSFAAPVLYTHAHDGVIFTLPDRESTGRGIGVGTDGALIESLRLSTAFQDDLVLASSPMLNEWRQTLKQAADAYRHYLLSGSAAEQEAAQLGLEVIRRRIQAIDARLQKPESQ
ncbi:MAG: CHAT domain-containing protein [Anaerolineae bacterium]